MRRVGSKARSTDSKHAGGSLAQHTPVHFEHFNKGRRCRRIMLGAAPLSAPKIVSTISRIVQAPGPNLFHETVYTCPKFKCSIA